MNVNIIIGLLGILFVGASYLSFYFCVKADKWEFIASMQSGEIEELQKEILKLKS